MIIDFSSDFKKSLSKIKRKNKLLSKKVKKRIGIFQKKPNHPSLRLHKLTGKQKEIWSISVDMSYRLLFYYQDNKPEKKVIFFDIGKHEEVYK